MSADGLISVRIPRSLMATFRQAAQYVPISVHEAARQTLEALDNLTIDDLRELRGAPWERSAERLSLYVGGWEAERFKSMCEKAGLSFSTVFRRLLYAQLVTG